MQHKLEDWLHPIVPGEAEIEGTWAYDNKVVLIAIAVACAVVGIVLAYLVYEKRRIKAYRAAAVRRRLELRRGDRWFMGNPGSRRLRGDSPTSTPRSSTVPSTVSPPWCVRPPGEVRKGQTGYVRQYAGVIGIGVVLLLGWFVVIRGIL